MAQELEYYKEHVAHGRHVELQRSAVAGLAATLAGEIVGELLKQGSLTRVQLPYTVALFVLGLVAFLLSAKLYERFKLHNAIAKEARDKLDPTLGSLRTIAENEHKKNFPILYDLPLHVIWNCLFLFVCALGLATTVMCIWFPVVVPAPVTKPS
jgi:hypothetical protein